MGVKKGKSNGKSGKSGKGGGIAGKVKGLIGGKSGSGTTGKRRRGVTYWSNKVLVEKLKKRYYKLKYGSVR